MSELYMMVTITKSTEITLFHFLFFITNPPLCFPRIH